MLKLPRKTMYALGAVVDIAYNARPQPVQSKAITERQGIPQRYLEQVMQQLVHAGVLKGVRGPKGGYALARERRRISVGEVVRAIDGQPGGDGEAAEDKGSDLGRRIVSPILGELQAEMMRRLDEITLEDLCSKARALGIRTAQAEAQDFNI